MQNINQGVATLVTEQVSTFDHPLREVVCRSLGEKPLKAVAAVEDLQFLHRLTNRSNHKTGRPSSDSLIIIVICSKTDSGR